MLSYRGLTDADLAAAVAGFEGGDLVLTGNLLTYASAAPLVRLASRYPECRIYFGHNALRSADVFWAVRMAGRRDLASCFPGPGTTHCLVRDRIMGGWLHDDVRTRTVVALDDLEHRVDRLCDIVAAHVAGRPSSMSLEADTARARLAELQRVNFSARPLAPS